MDFTDDTQGICPERRLDQDREEGQILSGEPQESAQSPRGEKAQGEKIIIFIYALEDEFGNIRYVGKTTRPKQRFQFHCYTNGRSHKDNWIKSLLDKGLKPTMSILDELECVLDEEWHELEKFWIAYLRFLGCDLTNLENGGQGAGRISEQTRSKMSAKRKGKKWFPMPPETKAKLIASHLGKPWSEASKEKLRTTMKATNAVQRLLNAPRPEHAWNKGIAHKEETKKKMSETHRARGTGKGPKSLEHREKLRQANLGKKLSDDHRQKLRGPRGKRGPNITTLRKLGLAPPTSLPSEPDPSDQTVPQEDQPH